ncbi:MAG: NADH-specific enoyl-ACP reductase [Chloroflexi bacterium]|nr:MAG: NADH-specific enoyl-ACP reductase [Chloroflexota bacterium]
MGMMDGRKCLIMGVANQRSIAWGIAQALQREGATLAFSYVNDRLKDNVAKLVAGLPNSDTVPMLPCDVQAPGEVGALFAELQARWGSLDVFVHSIAFARPEDLGGNFSDVSWDGYALAQHVSAYSLIETSRHAKPLMEAAGGGSIMTLSYLAAERVVEKYNVMAVAKAALECNVRYLAAEFGPSNIRVNAISAGPLRTLAASAVKGLREFQHYMEEKAPLRRNVTQEEVGDVGLFLASPLSRCITGETIYADNGYHILGM